MSLEKSNNDLLEISSVRKGEIPGKHRVSYYSDTDKICIKHKAFKRDGFAIGAIIAAEWILNKEGILAWKMFLVSINIQ